MAVYCIADVSRTVVKVGYTKDEKSAKARLKCLQTACPFRLQLLAFCSHMTKRDEKYIHDLINQHRLDGGTEWFAYECIAVIAEYMKFDSQKHTDQQGIENCSTKNASTKELFYKTGADQSPDLSWSKLGITEGKEPDYSDKEVCDTDDTDFCPVLERCVTEYARDYGVEPECLLYPDSYFPIFPEYYIKFLPRSFSAATYSEMSKELVRATVGEKWNPSQVMAKIVAYELCSFTLDSETGKEEDSVYPLLSKEKPGHIIMMCFSNPKKCIDLIELFIDEFFWDLDCYEMCMSFLIIDEIHNYYEATHYHPLNKLNRDEIARLRFGDSPNASLSLT